VKLFMASSIKAQNWCYL